MHTTRNATLQDLAAMLQDQNARKVDVVAPASAIRSEGANLRIDNTVPEITDDGVTMTDGIYRPTTVADEGIAEKLGIPVAYLRRLREQRPDLYDANVNGWLQGSAQRHEVNPSQADQRAFLIRCFRPEADGQLGIARAMLSQNYRVIDNLDVLTSALDGVRQAGLQVNVHACDLTERRMHIRLHAPAIETVAPKLLQGYRSPFTGESGTDLPIVYAGLRISNSEVGGGAFSIVPEIRIRICSNGMTVTQDVMRNIHLGGKLEEGIVRWSDETQQRALELVKSKTVDAVRTFLDIDYLTKTVARLEAKAEEPVASVDQVQVIAKKAGVAQADIDGLLGYFVQGGQMTLAGVANAMTAYSQGLPDGDAAAELDAQAAALLLS